VCRPKAAAVLPKMFCPCEQVAALGLTSTGSSSAECLAALRSALANNYTALSLQFPFNVPPLVDTALLNASTQADTSCPPGQALSPWFGGECIPCGNGTLDVSVHVLSSAEPVSSWLCVRCVSIHADGSCLPAWCRLRLLIVAVTVQKLLALAVCACHAEENAVLVVYFTFKCSKIRLCVLQASASKCICYPGYTTNVAGPSACGPALSESWNVSSAAELAQQLCTQYSRCPDLMQQV
jgi:hypothetical protein